jgi:hypothetical protein
MKDFKPHIVIIGGDFMDFNYLSGWSQRRVEYFLEDKPREEYDRDIELANEILDAIGKTHVKKDAQLEFMIGNHEVRRDFLMSKFADKSRTIMDAYDYRRDLDLDARGWKVHGENQIVKKGRLYFMHGFIWSKYHAEKYLTMYGKNMRYGHTHDIQIHSAVSPIDHHERLAMSCGCLCNKEPGYKKRKPTRWQNAFHTAYINDDGSFNEYLVKIPYGKFFRDGSGKLYSNKEI